MFSRCAIPMDIVLKPFPSQRSGLFGLICGKVCFRWHPEDAIWFSIPFLKDISATSFPIYLIKRQKRYWGSTICRIQSYSVDEKKENPFLKYRSYILIRYRLKLRYRIFFHLNAAVLFNAFTESDIFCYYRYNWAQQTSFNVCIDTNLLLLRSINLIQLSK